MFHHDAERTSRTRWWTYRARPSSRPSRIHSLRRAAQSSSAHCGIRRNRVCAPSLRTRCSQTRTCGRTHTTCSGSASGQASAGPRCVFAVSRVERLTERVFFPFPSCFVGDVLVVGRPSIRLCNYASDGVGRRSLPHVLSHQRRRLCRTIQRFTSRRSRYRLIARGGRGGPIAPDASPCAHSNLKITPSTGNRVPLCARLRSGQS